MVHWSRQITFGHARTTHSRGSKVRRWYSWFLWPLGPWFEVWYVSTIETSQPDPLHGSNPDQKLPTLPIFKAIGPVSRHNEEILFSISSSFTMMPAFVSKHKTGHSAASYIRILCNVFSAARMSRMIELIDVYCMGLRDDRSRSTCWNPQTLTSNAPANPILS